MAEKEEEEQTIATDLVVTKYKMAAELVNGVYDLEYMLMLSYVQFKEMLPVADREKLRYW